MKWEARSAVSPKLRKLSKYMLGGASIIYALVALLIPVASPLRAQPDPDLSQSAGCYELRLGPWSPPIRDGQFEQLPSHIELSLEKVDHPLTKGALAVRFPRSGKTAWSAEWTLRGPALELAWIARYGGLTMRLEPRGAQLLGVAKTFWDHHQSEESARAIAVRERCESP